MNENKLRFRIGIFVLLALAALTGLVVMFGGGKTVFVTGNEFVVILDNGAGIGPGTPVRRSGVRIGEVRKVELDDETGVVRVTIEVQRMYTIRTHEEPVVTRNFLGDPVIDFVPRSQPESKAAQGQRSSAGEASEESDGGDKAQPAPVPPGTELKGRTQKDASAALTEMEQAARNFNRMMPSMEKAVGEMSVMASTWRGLGENVNVLLKTNEKQIVQTLENVNLASARAAEVLGPENQRNLNSTLKNVQKTSENLDPLFRNADQFMKDGQNTLKQVNGSLTQLDQLTADLNRATKPLADRSASITKNVDESAVKLNQLLTSMQQMFPGGAKGEGTLNRLLNDPALYNSLNAAACGLARMMPQLERILKDVEVFADKIARHPEALGVGGAVRPGSGLK